MRCSNTGFYVYLRKLSRNWGQFSSTVKNIAKHLRSTGKLTLKNHIKKLYYYISFLWDFMWPKIFNDDFITFFNLHKDVSNKNINIKTHISLKNYKANELLQDVKLDKV